MRRALLSRAGWAVGDQILASATNFMLLVVVARAVVPDRFGLFAVLMATYVLVAYIGRGATSDPLVTRFSAADLDVWRSAVRASLGAALAIGITLGGVTLVVAACLPADVGGPVAALSVVVPGVLLQDHIRFAFFSRGRARAAFGNDLLWAIAQLVGVAVALHLDGSGSIVAIVLVWGLSGGMAAVVGVVQLGERPAPLRARWWFRENRDLWKFFAAENALLQITNVLVLVMVGLVAGLSASGSLRAAAAVFGPLTILALGTMSVGVPELARRGGGPRVRHLATVAGAGLAVLAAAWGVTAFLLPLQVGELLLGDTWTLAHPILLVVTVDAVAQLFIVGPFMGLRAIGSGKRSLGVRSGFAAVRLAVACGGAATGGALGAAIGFALMAPIQMVVWWCALRAGTASQAGRPAALKSSSAPVD